MNTIPLSRTGPKSYLLSDKIKVPKASQLYRVDMMQEKMKMDSLERMVYSKVGH